MHFFPLCVVLLLHCLHCHSAHARHPILDTEKALRNRLGYGTASCDLSSSKKKTPIVGLRPHLAMACGVHAVLQHGNCVYTPISQGTSPPWNKSRKSKKGDQNATSSIEYMDLSALPMLVLYDIEHRHPRVLPRPVRKCPLLTKWDNPPGMGGPQHKRATVSGKNDNIMQNYVAAHKKQTITILQHPCVMGCCCGKADFSKCSMWCFLRLDHMTLTS